MAAEGSKVIETGVSRRRGVVKELLPPRKAPSETGGGEQSRGG